MLMGKNTQFIVVRNSLDRLSYLSNVAMRLFHAWLKVVRTRKKGKDREFSLYHNT
jgi:hypothetical protein